MFESAYFKENVGFANHKQFRENDGTHFVSLVKWPSVWEKVKCESIL